MSAEPEVLNRDATLAQTHPRRSTAYDRLKRAMDILLAIFALAALAPVLAFIAVAVKMTSPGPILHWSKRVGRSNTLFLMPKFRSMRIGTPQLATHLLEDPGAYLTAVGRFLRRASLDELPQLYSILKGDLTFVGPRPALFNQNDLVELRTQFGIHELVPGLTGWAQINGRDELSIPAKVGFEYEYLSRRSICFDLQILFRTLWSALFGKGVSH